jgi:ABC-2 type transport system permease protein
MSADTTADRLTTLPNARRPSLGASLIGLGSVFGKTMRDSRRAILIALVFTTLMLLTGAAAIASAFGTAETRQEMINLATTLPAVFQGELGRPVGLQHLGGLIEWRYHSVFLLFLPVWSIVALSGTLASEASRGSLDIVLTSQLTRRRVALEKVAAHVVGVTIVMLGLTLMTWLSGAAFGTLPGDEIALGDAAAYSLLTGLLMLLPGSIAFAASAVVGRGAAAGLAAVVLLASYFINGYRSMIPAFEAATPLSWYAWTGNHIPLAGLYDWTALGLVALITLGIVIAGVLAFERRDVGITIRVPAPHLPAFLIGLRGPLGRTFGDRIPTATAWGLGIGFYVLLVSTSAKELASLIAQVPSLQQMMQILYPDIDFGTVGGVLQLIFIGFGLLVFGFTTATIVGGWASEESSGRLEVVLSAPMTRFAWFVRSGLGAFGAILLATTIVAAASAMGAISQGSDVAAPAIGTYVLALYGGALAGIGMAVAGLVRSSLAAPTVIVVTVGTFLIALLAAALKLPDWVADLDLTSHYGQPLVGHWDPVGIAASLALAIGGLLLGAWGLSRRDLRA